MTKLFRNHEWRFIFLGDRLECMQKKKIEKKGMQSNVHLHWAPHCPRQKGLCIVLMQTQQRFAPLIVKIWSNLTTYKCLYIV